MRWCLVVLAVSFVGPGPVHADRKTPTRSEAFAFCKRQSSAGQADWCENLIRRAEFDHWNGEWRPNQGPYRGCERSGYADTEFRKACRYIGNLDNDPEFQAVTREVADTAESRKRQIAEDKASLKRLAEEEEAARKRPGLRATLDGLISEVSDFAASSPEQVLLAINQGTGDPYSVALKKLESAEEKLAESVLGPDADEYRRQIQELKPRVDAVALSYAMMMSRRSNQISSTFLRKTPLEEIEDLKAPYEVANSAVLKLRSHVGPESDRAKQLVHATTKFGRVLREIEAEILRKQKALARREEIGRHMRFLCVELPKRQRALQEEIRYKREVDRESGTRDLALDRELAEEKITLREERASAIRRLKQLGAPYSKSKCGTLE